METKLVVVQLQDEAPKMGSGVRRLEVQVGHKYVYLRNPYTGKKQRIRRYVWDTLKPVEINLCAST